MEVIIALLALAGIALAVIVILWSGMVVWYLLPSLVGLGAGIAAMILGDRVWDNIGVILIIAGVIANFWWINIGPGRRMLG